MAQDFTFNSNPIIQLDPNFHQESGFIIDNHQLINNMDQNIHQQVPSYNDIFWVKSGDFMFWPRKLNDFELGKIVSEESAAQCLPYNTREKNELIRIGLDTLKLESLVVFKDLVLQAEGLSTSSFKGQVSFFKKIKNNCKRTNEDVDGDAGDIDMSERLTPLLPPSSPPPAKRSNNEIKITDENNGNNSGQLPSAPVNPNLMPKLYSILTENPQQHDNNDVKSENKEPMDLVSAKEQLYTLEFNTIQLKNMILTEEKNNLAKQISDMTISHKSELDEKANANLLLNSRIKYLENKVIKVLETNGDLEKEFAEFKIKTGKDQEKFEIKLKLRSEEINRRNAIIQELKQHVVKEFEKLLPTELEIDG